MPSDVKVKPSKKPASCFVNLSVIADLSRGGMIADLVAILGSIDSLLGGVDR